MSTITGLTDSDIARAKDILTRGNAIVVSDLPHQRGTLAEWGGNIALSEVVEAAMPPLNQPIEEHITEHIVTTDGPSVRFVHPDGRETYWVEDRDLELPLRLALRYCSAF